MIGESLVYMNCDRTTDMLRASLRAYRDAYAAQAGTLPEAGVMAGALMLSMRGGVTHPGALCAMYVGLRVLSVEVLGESQH